MIKRVTATVYMTKKGDFGVVVRIPQEVASAFAVGNEPAADLVRGVIAEALESENGAANGLVK